MGFKIRHINELNFQTMYNKTKHIIETSIMHKDGKKSKTNLHIIPACLDCETTTKDDKSYVYIYQLSFGEYIFYFRNKLIFKFLHCLLSNLTGTLIIGIANTSFDLTFMYNQFNDEMFKCDCSFNIISPKPHHPIMLEIERDKGQKIRFVDICKMTNLPLSEIAKNYTKVKKLVGDLDYTKQRHFETRMTISEYRYCIYDVIIGHDFLEYIYNEYTLKDKKFPITATSIPRNKIKDKFKELKIKNTVPALFPDGVTEYLDTMAYLFRGGFVHGNKEYTAKTVYNVTCSDFTSSYPAVMLQETFPMTKFKPIFNLPNVDCENDIIPDLKFENGIAYIIDVTFYNIYASTSHTLESEQKAIELEKPVLDNGRILKADKLRVVLTELDYLSYMEMYFAEHIQINSMKTSVKQPLPEYVKSVIIEEYAKKSMLKQTGQSNTALYMATKGIVNSTYGCMIQKLNFTNHVLMINENTGLFDFVKYESCLDMERTKSYEKWYEKTLEKLMTAGNDEYTARTHIERDLKHNKLMELYYYKEKSSKILSCYWGIWVTAYARRRLIENMMKLEYIESDSVVYYDTDSLYIKDYQSNKQFQNVINSWNDKIFSWNKKHLPDGCQDLGLFDTDPENRRFKHLGAKRYIKEVFDKKENKYIVKQTIAGLKKGTLQRVIKDEYIIEKSDITDMNDKIFDMFNFGMSVSMDLTDKLASCYINSEYSDIITDEDGKQLEMSEKGGIVLQKVEFNIMSIEKFFEYASDFH